MFQAVFALAALGLAQVQGEIDLIKLRPQVCDGVIALTCEKWSEMNLVKKLECLANEEKLGQICVQEGLTGAFGSKYEDKCSSAIQTECSSKISSDSEDYAGLFDCVEDLTEKKEYAECALDRDMMRRRRWRKDCIKHHHRHEDDDDDDDDHKRHHGHDHDDDDDDDDDDDRKRHGHHGHDDDDDRKHRHGHHGHDDDDDDDDDDRSESYQRHRRVHRKLRAVAVVAAVAALVAFVAVRVQRRRRAQQQAVRAEDASATETLLAEPHYTEFKGEEPNRV
jgi:hypothetical protein